MALWEKFGEYHADEPFLPWAYRFAHFKVLAHRKKNRRQPALLEEDVLNILVEEQVQEDERLEAQLRLLPACLDKLTPNERRILQVRYDGRATVAQIAEETGQLAETLYRVLHPRSQEAASLHPAAARAGGRAMTDPDFGGEDFDVLLSSLCDTGLEPRQLAILNRLLREDARLAAVIFCTWVSTPRFIW